MKKILLLAAVVFSVATVNAQNLSFGPTAGFGHSWLGGDDINFKGKFHPSYNLGGKLVYSFVSHWGISADVKFSSEGTTRVDGDEKYKYRLNYVRVPLQGIYFFGEYGDAVRPKVSLGPSFGFLVGGKSKREENGEVQSEVNSKEIFKGFDLGLNVAAGANFRVASGTWLNTDITYNHGFTNILEASGGDVFNRGIGVNVGLTFGIGTVKPGK